MGLGTLILIILGVAWYVYSWYKHFTWKHEWGMIPFQYYITIRLGSAILLLIVVPLIVCFLNQIRVL